MLHAILTCLALKRFSSVWASCSPRHHRASLANDLTGNNAFNHRDTGCGW